MSEELVPASSPIIDLLDVSDQKTVTGSNMIHSATADRRVAFLLDYLVDFNVSRASKAVGMTVSNGYRILRTPEAKEAIKLEMRERRSCYSIETAMILHELATIAYGSLANYQQFLKDGDLSKLPAEHAAALQEITQETFTTREGEQATRIKIKMSEKVRALELLGKYQKMWGGADGEGNSSPVVVNLNVEFE